MDTTAHNSDFSTRIRCLEWQDSCSLFFFVIGHKAFQEIDCNGLIEELSSADVFTGSGTDSADDGGEWVSFLDNLDGTSVVFQLNLFYIFTDIDAGGAGPLAGCRTILGGVLTDNAACNRGQGDDMFWTDPFACTAPGAFDFVHHGKTIGSHGDGIERAYLCTGSKTQASDPADFHPSVDEGGSPAISQTVIKIFYVGSLETIGTSRSGNIRFFGFNSDAQYSGNGFGNFRTRCHTGIGRRFSGNNRFCICAAAGKTAAPAIGTWKGFIDSDNQGIHINIKYFGCHGQTNTHKQSKTSHHEYGFNHCLLLFKRTYCIRAFQKEALLNPYA